MWGHTPGTRSNSERGAHHLPRLQTRHHRPRRIRPSPRRETQPEVSVDASGAVVGSTLAKGDSVSFQIPTWKVYLRDNTVYRVSERDLPSLLNVLIFNGQPFDVRREDESDWPVTAKGIA